jgi:hypothetical protein
MRDLLAAELDAVLKRLQSEHDVLPFIQTLMSSADARLMPLPAEMMEQLKTSSDFASVRPGEPVWISLSAPDDLTAEIVVYRAEGNGTHYVLAPARY